jgi:hypothetical protein
MRGTKAILMKSGRRLRHIASPPIRTLLVKTV